jgi:hypothetical protein
MNNPLVPYFDGNDFTVDELREAISLLQDELDGRDKPTTDLSDFRVSSSDPDARFPEDFQRRVMDALHAYDPWAREVVSLSRVHMGGKWLVVRYDREFMSNLSFVMKDEA